LAPEKRDAALRRTQIQRYARVLEPTSPEQLDQLIDAEVAQTPKGKQPPPLAWTLAYEQAMAQLEFVVADLNAIGLTSLRAGGNRGEWPIEQPNSLNLSFARIGLPLFGSLAPSAGGYLSWMRSALALRKRRTGEPAFTVARSTYAASVADFLLSERALWLPGEMPYAFRWAALSVLWLPAAHKAQTMATLCLRCGDVHQRQRDINRVSLCGICAKNDAHSAHTWPTHAICPAGRGTWWLTCQQPHCDAVFRAQRQARKCAAHKKARLTASKRAAA